jgi:hypothetical protein
MARGYCNAVESSDCEAPAGYRTGRGSVGLPQRTGLARCGYCDEPVCGPCSTEVDGQRVCLTHDETELALWMGLTLLN